MRFPLHVSMSPSENGGLVSFGLEFVGKSPVV